VLGVVGAELENLQQLDQPGSVVVGVGGLEHPPLVPLVGTAGPVLAYQLGQTGLTAHHRVDNVADRFCRGLQ
jgi:hypothetical protein